MLRQIDINFILPDGVLPDCKLNEGIDIIERNPDGPAKGDPDESPKGNPIETKKKLARAKRLIKNEEENLAKRRKIQSKKINHEDKDLSIQQSDIDFFATKHLGSNTLNELLDKNFDRFKAERNLNQHMKLHTVEKVRKYADSCKLGYAVAVLSLNGKMNVGSIIRTAHLMGADDCIVFGRKKFNTTTGTGVVNYQKITKVYGFTKDETDHSTNNKTLCPNRFYQHMVLNNYVPVFIEQTQNSIFDDQIVWSVMERKIKENYQFCFVFGNESEGIPSDLLETGLQIPGAFTICIRQLGVMNSLNVAAAAAIILSNYKLYKYKKIVDRII